MRRSLATIVVAVMAGLLPACRGCRSGEPPPPAGVGGGPGGQTASAPRQRPPIRFGALPAPAPPGASQSLAGDLAAGRLSPDDAARYRVYRFFKPSAVPERYRYARAPRSGTWDLLQVSRQWGRLSPRTRDELTPYLVRPTDARSIFAQPRRDPPMAAGAVRLPFEAVLHADDPWFVEEFQTGTGYTIRIVGERGLADTVRKARRLVEQNRMYEKFEALLGRKTLDYGDRTLVIHIVSELVDPETREGGDKGSLGLCFSELSGDLAGLPEGTAAAWIAISAAGTAQDPLLAATLAHEMFHAFQFAFSTEEEKWLVEGSAEWAEDFIGHDWNDEQDYLDDGTFDAARFVHNRLNETSADTAYGMYLFFYYLSRVRSGADASVMRQIWLAAEAARGSTLASVKRAAGGDFNEVFHDYAHRTLDEGDAYGSFPDAVGQYTGFNPLPLSSSHGFLGLWHIDDTGTPARKAGLTVGGLGVTYAAVTNAAKGPTAPAVRFDLSEFKDKPEVGIRAVVVYADRTESEDWGGLSERVFCLAQAPQSFDQIYLEVSNSEDGAEPRSFALDLRPDPGAECAPAQLRLTMSEAGDEQEHRTVRKWDIEHDTRHSTTWRQDMALVLDLVPRRRNTERDAGAASSLIPEAVRSLFSEQMRLTLDGEGDEHTGCTKYTLRVRAVQLMTFVREKSVRSVEAKKDTHGLAYAGEVSQHEQGTAQGPARETLAWLADETLRVSVYLDARSGEIRWMRPEGPIGADWSETFTNRQESRTRSSQWPYTAYVRFADSSSKKRSGSTFVREVSHHDPLLPLNPDWKARTGTATSAEGGGQMRRPLGRTRESDAGDTTATTGAVTTTLKWELRLAYPVAQRK